ncbi:unnamed protein product [Kuraishia capsulata CBS 1993]|uniref:Major facilitator superfamily (MFS) profile domain-containing protein n=1 Tax=Kuraishia capsulata CBS 1993 TaxID=1382522 RepID=W6MLG0_9ASCO|nr:uncharacterized protein KUCA_T00002925001 [Kuraishia capsulata CBS 1993]CDK26948.1 unnamed protein product [Kuraishia capsulata CBS 1993]
MDAHEIPSGPLVGKALLYFTSVFVSLGVFLFGYDQGVMSGVITGPYFKLYFNNPSSSTIGTTVAILEIGALVSSLYVGHIGDVIGRRRTIRYGALIFVIGGAVQTFAVSIHNLILGRIISGIGVGLLSTIVPVYQSEISPPHNRGKLACIEFTGNIVGYASSVWTDYFCTFIESDLSWRVPLFVQCVIGMFLLFGSFVIVESPRWLLDHDHDAEGIVVIADLYAGGDVNAEAAREEFRGIKESVLMSRMEGEKTYSEMFKRYSTRLFIAMSAQVFAQFNGINVISYYAPLVFEQAGWLGRDAILMTGINGIVYIMSTIPPWYLVDNWGRRPILISGGIIMALSLFMVSYVSYLDIARTPALVVTFVIIYNAGFGFSWGPIPWLFPPEILPLSVRAKGASMSTATNWAANFVVGQLAPVLLETIHWRLYLIHTASCIISVIVVITVYPETSGLQLEDMDSLFDDRSSTFSFHGNSSTYGATNDDDTSLLSSRFRSAAAMARHPLGDSIGSHSQLLHTSDMSVHSQTAHSPLIQPQDVEPPDLAAILAYKNSDQNSIRGSIRRGSEAVSSIFKFGKKDGDNESAYESDDQSSSHV